MTEGLKKTESESSLSSSSKKDGELEIGWMQDEPLWGEGDDVVIPPLWQPIIPILILLGCLFAFDLFYPEFSYSLSSRKAIPLGSVAAGCEDDFYKKLKHNRLVTIKNIIPQPNLTAETRIHFSRRYFVASLGCDLLVALYEKRYRRLMGLPEKKEKKGGKKGSKAKKNKEKEKENALKKLLAKKNIYIYRRSPLVIRGRIMQAIRSNSIAMLKRFYAVAEGMPITPQTYIIYDGEEPGNQYWILIGYVLLGLLFLYNLWRLVVSVWRNWIKYEKK